MMALHTLSQEKGSSLKSLPEENELSEGIYQIPTKE